METLKEKEWITLNKVILEIYSIETMEEFASHILKICRNLVPYDMGYFLIYDETEAVRVETGYSAAEGMDDELFSVYLKEYYAKDYLQYFISLFKESACYRDTDIMDERLRTKTEIFCHFMEPNGIPYGAGCVLWKGSQMRNPGGFYGQGNVYPEFAAGPSGGKTLSVVFREKESGTEQTGGKNGPLCGPDGTDGKGAGKLHPVNGRKKQSGNCG